MYLYQLVAAVSELQIKPQSPLVTFQVQAHIRLNNFQLPNTPTLQLANWRTQ